VTATGVLRDNYRNHAVNLATVALLVTVEQTKEAAPHASGALVNQITSVPPALEDPRVVAQIMSGADYSSFQDDGTGIFGPLKMRIFPTHVRADGRQALRFDWHGETVYFRSVAGSPAKNYFKIPMQERWHTALASNAGGGADG